MLFGGNVGDIDESIDETACEARAIAVREAIAELPEIVQLAWEQGPRFGETDDSVWEELDTMVRGRDDSDPLGDLIGATPRQLFRYKLSPDWWGHGQAHRRDAEEDEDFAFDIAVALGLTGHSFRDQRDTILELVQNAGDAQELYVIWYGEVEPLAELVIGYHFKQAGHDTPRTIRWTNASVVLLDRMSGQGHDVRIGDVIEASFDPERLTLDDEGFGYGWDRTACVHKPYYQNDPHITPAWEAPTP